MLHHKYLWVNERYEFIVFYAYYFLVRVILSKVVEVPKPDLVGFYCFEIISHGEEKYSVCVIETKQYLEIRVVHVKKSYEIRYYLFNESNNDMLAIITDLGSCITRDDGFIREFLDRFEKLIREGLVENYLRG